MKKGHNMGVTWTKEQQSVINLRNRNLLVSAAAGSGKTAVLVERILERICDAKAPVDIDRLLVVTFTKAAAAEMRERISDALEERREAFPEDRNIERQLTLLHNAMITTIDSFCVYVVRNYFQDIQLDPNFRIADAGEIKLLEEDALEALFEKNYETANKSSGAEEDKAAFLALADAYSGRRSDAAVKDMVKKIYHLSASNPWPKEWVENLCIPYMAEDEEALCNTDILKQICVLTQLRLQEMKRELSRLKERAAQISGLEKYVQTLERDLELFAGIDAFSSYPDFAAFFQNFKMGNIAAIRGFEGDETEKEAIKNGRGAVKKDMESLKKMYFSLPLKELWAQNKALRPMVEELVRLTLSYMEELEKRKRRKHIVDFSDIEHFALQILVDGHTKECRPAALEFRRHFDEIMIDEYQDGNEVQETILRAVSGEAEGRFNLFMVGDVKQSIYRFRLARPELFMEKYDTYSLEEDVCQRIDLHKNFRSRQEVLSCVNDIFYKIMDKDLGNVAYDSKAALYYGASYPECEGMEAELLLLDSGGELLADLEGENDRILEAHLAANRIRRLMEDQLVTDKQTGELRRIRYSDIVILFRSLKNWGTDFAQVLEQQGIPVHVESSTGYFSSVEVQTVLSMLRILDNPYQDIPMAAVLRSSIAGLDNEELAEIRVKKPNLPFAMAVVELCKEAADFLQDESLAEKLKAFWELYTQLRAEVRDTPVHELLHHILDWSGYGGYAASLPAGRQRAANLNMLLEKAIAYEKTSYKGLFHFVRYIDELQKYEVDFGEADVTAENEDAVHIMTIHKSKGLEFPVVFVSGMNKKFNRSDVKESMVLHADFGIGMEERKPEPRVKRNTINRSLIKEQLERENLGEELRILYVALTRAKEKLIMTGVLNDREKWYQTHQGNVKPMEALGFTERRKAQSYLDWVFSALLSYGDKYDIHFVDAEELAAQEVRAAAEHKWDRAQLFHEIQKVDLKELQTLDEGFSYVYPYLSDAGRKSKYSVSELKHDSMVEKFDHEQGDMEMPDFLREAKESYLPAFAAERLWKNAEADGDAGEGSLKSSAEEPAETAGREIASDDSSKQQIRSLNLPEEQAEASPGALRGTAVHRFMECLDFAAILELDLSDAKAAENFVKEQMSRMLREDKLTAEMGKLIIPAMLEAFVKDPLALRMAKADRAGKLFREKPFVMDYEGVLLQGIIDVFWQEEDRMILLDYKTDRVKTAEELRLRYQKQLELYGEALERIFSTGKRAVTAKEQLIYSFRLKEVIRL